MPWMQINTFRISSVFYIWIQLQKGHRDPNQFKTQDETSAYGKCANTKNKIQIEKNVLQISARISVTIRWKQQKINTLDSVIVSTSHYIDTVSIHQQFYQKSGYAKFVLRSETNAGLIKI